MKVGVTGTRSGMNERQVAELERFLASFEWYELHHGDCIGVDVEVADIATRMGKRTVCHPPVKSELRAFHKSTETRQAYSYFKRNRNIVDETDILIVIPWQDEHQNNGGTWYTHDYAVKKKKPLHVIFPERG